MTITKDIKYVGVNDHQVDLFEGQYDVPNGMCYNSYLILDENIAVLDTVDAHFKDEWLRNIEEIVGDNEIKYLIVSHMEPDHSSNILEFVKRYPNITIVSTIQAFNIMKQFFKTGFENQRIVVKEGDTLCLGKHTLRFVPAPMVHWPEVVMSYDECDKVLFSADAFGKFGALDVEEEWACEARRYYFGIVGKYGIQVQNVLKKLSQFEIRTICPLHGPILNDNLSYYLNLYNTWSSYQPESKGVMIAYSSIYGNTKKACELLKEKLEGRVEKVVLCDLAREDMAEAVEDAFRYDRLVLASSTYNGDVFPFMKEFINHLLERNYQNRVVGFIENGSWAPQAKKVMMKMFEGAKNIKYLENSVTILSSMNEKNILELENLAEELI